MGDTGDLHARTEEFPDDAAYAWWRNSHPAGFVLAVRARKEPVLHRAGCKDVDRDRKPGALKAKGSRQVCAASAQALRGWLAQESPEAHGVAAHGVAAHRLLAHGLLARCPKCGP